MKKVLITGSNSYIGKSFSKWIEKKYYNEIEVTKISVRDNTWITNDFSEFCTIVHLAGIVHSRNEKKENYYKVNCDLTLEIAKKSKLEGVSHFIFFSTMNVYGNVRGVIDENTPTIPVKEYGISKLKAEKELLKLEDDNFTISIIRPPLVYGPNCTGNYKSLSMFATRAFIFPDYTNVRSMIYIDNLSEFLSIVVLDERRGIFHPQNKEYVSTSQMVKLIASIHSNKIIMTPVFNCFIKSLVFRAPIVNKIFGNLNYKQTLSNINKEYCVTDFVDSIVITEKNKLKAVK